MNLLFNPVLLGKIVKSYLFDVNRVRRNDEEKIRKYQEKTLKQILKYAYTVPLYYKKYKAAGINPHDIKKIKDLEKLPMISKKDLSGKNVESLLPPNSDVKKFSMVKTSGSSGYPVTLYRDPYTTFQTFIGFLRIIREHNINWRKTRMVLIADLSPDSTEDTYFSSTALPSLNILFSLDNIKVFHVNVNPKELLDSIQKFNPEFIGGYPGVLKTLAIFKRQGKIEGPNLSGMATSGALLDNYTRKYIEKSFDTKIFDIYGATECSPMAFQCKQGNYHINSDFVHMEFIYPKEKETIFGDNGNLVITRLFGKGTPIIRYSGMNDFVVSSNRKCSCGLNTPLIEKIEGRRVDFIILPDGKVISPLTITEGIYNVTYKFNTDKIQQFQIIQQSSNEIDILIVIDQQLRNIGLKVDELFKAIREEYLKKMGNDVNINVREVDEIKIMRAGTPTPVVLSKISNHF